MIRSARIVRAPTGTSPVTRSSRSLVSLVDTRCGSSPAANTLRSGVNPPPGTGPVVRATIRSRPSLSAVTARVSHAGSQSKLSAASAKCSPASPAGEASAVPEPAIT